MGLTYINNTYINRGTNIFLFYDYLLKSDVRYLKSNKSRNPTVVRFVNTLLKKNNHDGKETHRIRSLKARGSIFSSFHTFSSLARCPDSYKTSTTIQRHHFWFSLARWYYLCRYIFFFTSVLYEGLYKEQINALSVYNLI